MKTEETIKLIKYVTGSVAAVLLAAALQLQFAYAAGIITLLTIQDTKKETVRITAKRMIIFVIMTILSAVIFPLAGSLVQLVGKDRAVVAEDMSGPYRHVRSLDVCVAGGQS